MLIRSIGRGRYWGACVMAGALAAPTALWAGGPPTTDYNTPAASAAGQPGAVPYRMPSADTITQAEKPAAGFNWFGLKKPKEPEVNPSQFPFARLCERRGDLAQARHIYQLLRDKDPANQQYHHRLAVLAAREGKLAEADQHFQRTFETGPGTPDVLSDYGYFLYLQHRLPEAERVLRDALSQEPQHQSALNNLGLTLGQLGRFEESLATFRQGGTDAEAHSNLAYVYSVLGAYDRAITHYSHALTLDPTMRKAAEAMLQVQRQKQAAEMMHAQTAQAPGAPVPTSASAAAGVPGYQAMTQGSPAAIPLVGQTYSPSAGGPPQWPQHAPPAMQPQPAPAPFAAAMPGGAYDPRTTAMPTAAAGGFAPPTQGVVPAAAMEPYAWPAGAAAPQPVTVAPYHAQPSTGAGASYPPPYNFQHVPAANAPDTAPQSPTTPATGARITNVRPR